MSEEPDTRRFGILAYDPTKPMPRRSANHLLGIVYTKEEVEGKLENCSKTYRSNLAARVVELVPVATDTRKVTVTKEVIV